MDNVHFTTAAKDFRQRLSDEICRIITEPAPHIEMRRLYTTNEIVQIPVSSVFALTALEQPFFNNDLIQRAAIFELDAITGGHDSFWTERQIELGGGRVGWIAHHLAVLHRFLNLAKQQKGWDHHHKASHRLANYEQCLQLMAAVFGLDHEWIPGALVATTSEKLSESDWALQGLIEFVKETKNRRTDWKDTKWSAGDISSWAGQHEVFYKNGALTNAWRLGRYMSSHKQDIERATGLVENGKFNNKRVYSINK